MAWTCQCTATQPDDARFCDRCGSPMKPSQVQLPNPFTSNVWKLGAIAAVLVVGGIFGTLVAVAAFGGGGHTSDQTSPNSDPRPSYQQAFDASFKNSCRQSAMRSGSISRASADNYCDCALPVFNQTHDMAKVVASCKKYVMR
jgi:hypothetical protein